MAPLAYYNEHDPFAAAWLRELIKARLIADGEVDERDIRDVQACDVRGFTQCHFFAGIGGWSYALRLAGWPDDRPVWTGSCPCQPFSSSSNGYNKRTTEDRHLWPVLARLIATEKPRAFIGEQVAQSGDWFAEVCADLETSDYEVGAAILPAVALGFDHARSRLYFIGNSNLHGQPPVAVDASQTPRMPWSGRDAARVAKANGLSRDMVALSGFGNAIVPQVAAEVIKAYMEIRQ